jgi:hypothetical protein
VSPSTWYRNNLPWNFRSTVEKNYCGQPMKYWDSSPWDDWQNIETIHRETYNKIADKLPWGVRQNIEKNWQCFLRQRAVEIHIETAVKISRLFTGRRQKKSIVKFVMLSLKYRENSPSNTDGTVFGTDQKTTACHEMKFRKSETRLSVTVQHHLYFLHVIYKRVKSNV